MYGHFFLGLKRFLISSLGIDVWNKLLRDSGMNKDDFQPFTNYSLGEGEGIFTRASDLLGKDIQDFYEEFGEYIMPGLMKMYTVLINPTWRTLDLIENVEETVHRILRIQYEQLNPPELKCVRTGSDEVIVMYSSPYQMCGLAKGMLKGIARYYDEKIIVSETRCMLRQEPGCIFMIKKVL